MRYATPLGLRAFVRATPAVLCIALFQFLPISASADDAANGHSTDAAGAASVAVPAEPSGLISTVRTSVTTKVQSAANLVFRSTQDVTEQAMDLIGVRYRFGGQSPENGLDCSGLVKYVFEQVTGIAMPRSARDQARVGEIV